MLATIPIEPGHWQLARITEHMVMQEWMLLLGLAMLLAAWILRAIQTLEQ